MARHDREDPHSLEDQLAWLDAIKEMPDEVDIAVSAVTASSLAGSAPVGPAPAPPEEASPYPKDPWASVPSEPASGQLFRSGTATDDPLASDDDAPTNPPSGPFGVGRGAFAESPVDTDSYNVGAFGGSDGRTFTGDQDAGDEPVRGWLEPALPVADPEPGESERFTGPIPIERFGAGRDEHATERFGGKFGTRDGGSGQDGSFGGQEGAYGTQDRPFGKDNPFGVEDGSPSGPFRQDASFGTKDGSSGSQDSSFGQSGGLRSKDGSQDSAFGQSGGFGSKDGSQDSPFGQSGGFGSKEDNPFGQSGGFGSKDGSQDSSFGQGGGFGSKDGSQDSSFGQSGAFGTKDAQDSFDTGPFSTKDNPFGVRDTPFGSRDSSFGAAESPFGTKDGSFGAKDDAFGTKGGGSAGTRNDPFARDDALGSRDGRGERDQRDSGNTGNFPDPRDLRDSGGTGNFPEPRDLREGRDLREPRSGDGRDKRDNRDTRDRHAGQEGRDTGEHRDLRDSGAFGLAGNDENRFGGSLREDLADRPAFDRDPGDKDREPYQARRRQAAAPPSSAFGTSSRTSSSRSGGKPSADSLDPLSLLKGRRNAPENGWRRLIYKASAGIIKPGESSDVRRRRDLIARARTPVAAGHHRVAVLSLKGGVGKTTTTVGLGATLAQVRGDRVIAVDANPDRGTLSDKVELETSATIRDLLNERGQIRRYVDIRAFTSQTQSRLEILGSDRDPSVSEAFSASDYQAVSQVLENFYSICITDCGTGLLHSAMSGVLGLADQLVLVSSPSVDGARAASATLDWLEAHHYADLVKAASVVLCSVRPRSKSTVDLNRLEAHFAARCRAVIRVPYDPHLEEGAEIDLDRMQEATQTAFLKLAASVGDGFAGPQSFTERRYSEIPDQL
ncbi:hypothetical protein Acor_72130 [Acrocarpospora corrugata]|uniref:CobQ/CobB/MinD/ParA nucleotide binding domain-containing protein n=1 Tax=Acrocarpospora corrugata TaxID=35763 RepID=A0A5M3W7W1_9ACTN|nr:MinD/ParA family protein [Acrocarpospora corrugata]GES05145.1 hypothetical protein Acor_72130 [Acrocarpospora corrugata]